MKRDEEFIQKLIEEYKNGLNMKEISLKYHTDCQYQFKTHNVFEKYGFKKKSALEARKRNGRFKLNWDCSSCSNEIEAYILGFLFSDGYISGQQLGLRLKKTDKDVLRKIKDYFCEQIKLQEEKTSYTFVVSSYKVINNLMKIGMKRNKSYKELSIPNIPIELKRHFIRGYFDGDGTIYVCKRKKYNHLKAAICSSSNCILKEFKKEMSLYNIDSTINKENRIGKTMKLPNNRTCIGQCDMYRLFIRKKDSLKLLYDYLYKDATIYLSRKKEIFDNNFDLLEFKPRKYRAN